MWQYQGRDVTDEDIKGFVGFTYCITNQLTNKKYIGKKLLEFSKTRQVKGKKKKFKVESDWKTYFGSNEELKQDVEKYGESNFKREIIRLCKSKGECSYYEAREQFATDALMSEDYYNSWLSVRVRKSHLK